MAGNMRKAMSGGLSRLRRRCSLRKTTVAWTVRLLVCATLLFLVRQYALRPAVKPLTAAGRCKFPLQLDVDARTDDRGPVGPLPCDGQQQAWVCVRGSEAGLCNATLDRFRWPVSCHYDFLVDGGLVLDTAEATGSDTVQLRSDFFSVRCRTVVSSGQVVTWEGKMAAVVPRPEVRGRRAAPASGQSEGRLVNASVLLWDLGPVSRLTFVRRLTKTHDFIVQQLRGLVFSGYNSVGAEGQGALTSLLTGSDAILDGVKFVWEEYRRRGYVTALAMDRPAVSRKEGAEVDHDMGQLDGQFVEEKGDDQRMCFGHRNRLQVAMDWTVDFFDAYPNHPKLAILGQRQMAKHGVIELTDEDNVRFLKELQVKGHLDNAVVIVVGDSGPRAGIHGESQRSKMEEQLPFLSVSVPWSFESEFPESSISLQMNTERLVSQPDVHATLLDLLDLVDGRMGRRSQGAISLLAEVPAHRTCEDASIPAPFCTCLQGVGVSTWGLFVRRAADQLVDFLNARTEEHRSACARLRLVSVASSRKYVPNAELLRGGRSWSEVLLGEFFNVHVAEEELYHLTVVADPGGRNYAAYFLYTASDDRLLFDERWVHRNTEDDTRECVPNGSFELQVICQCEVY